MDFVCEFWKSLYWLLKRNRVFFFLEELHNGFVDCLAFAVGYGCSAWHLGAHKFVSTNLPLSMVLFGILNWMQNKQIGVAKR